MMLIWSMKILWRQSSKHGVLTSFFFFYSEIPHVQVPGSLKVEDYIKRQFICIEGGDNG